MNSRTKHSILVSVVIPNFNCLHTLPEALNSVTEQSEKRLEIIVVDDGSTDESRHWLNSQQINLPNLVVLHTNREGPAAARNRAIQQAKGRYIAFLDADDTWQTDKLAAQIGFLEKNASVAFSFTNFQQIDESKKQLGEGFSCWESFCRQVKLTGGYQLLKDPLVTLYKENPVGTSTVVARRQRLLDVGLFDESLTSAEDMDMWLKLSREGAVAYSNEVATTYLVRAGSESSKFDERMDALRQIENRFIEHVKQCDPHAAQFFKARMQAARAQIYRSQGQFLKAFCCHSKAFYTAPTVSRLKPVLMDVINPIKMKFQQGENL